MMKYKTKTTPSPSRKKAGRGIRESIEARERNAHRSPAAIYEALSDLENLRDDPRVDEYFGPSFILKLAVLLKIRSGDSPMTEIARKFGVTKQAVSLHAIRAREIFGSSQG
jgi:hypothetical protein